ncbi:Modification methylase DpnIIB [compost metagenome]
MARDGNRGSGVAANNHPTVKPTDLMAYLLRLVTPPGGIALDPFMGSGSTGKAAMREGFRFIGCELSPEYLAIAQARIEHEHGKRVAAIAAQALDAALPTQHDLFAEAAG